MSDDNSPLIRFTPEKSSYYRDDSKTKPTSSVGTGKDFKKILSKDRREGDGGSVAKKKVNVGESDDEHNEEIAEVDESEHTPSGSYSLFDLSKNTSSKNAAPQSTPDNQTLFGTASKDTKPIISDDALIADSPSVLFAKNVAKQPMDKDSEVGLKAQIPQEELHVDIAAPEKPFNMNASTSQGKQTKDNSRFATEQSDLSYINPLGNASMQVNATGATGQAQPAVSSVDMQAMIDKLVKEVQVMESNGKTETTMVLKNPPLLEGASITVTAFDSASKEFNISFENLTQAGQQLLSQQSMRSDLMHTLEQKGYNVHILTTTTYDENRLYTAGADESQRDRNRDDGRDGSRDDRNRGEERPRERRQDKG